ncbi:MAG: hypothetical protein VX768_07650 [Planctomycetota bacterium]|nr:hypothetical protein [Planctomycetota bacterium]
MRRKLFVLLVTLAFGTLFGGCNRTESTASKDDLKAGVGSSGGFSHGSGQNDLSSVNAVPSEGQGLKSPAKSESGPQFAPSLDPSSVTSAYLRFLKEALSDADSLKNANELLTAEARKATNLANVDVSLPGSVNSEYVVHQAEYVTNEKTLAHVRTSWKDRVEDEKFEYDVTWMLKKEDAVGWRVSGMITTGENGDQTVVFNFEDAADIVSKGAPQTGEVQTAGNPGESKLR